MCPKKKKSIYQARARCDVIPALGVVFTVRRESTLTYHYLERTINVSRLVAPSVILAIPRLREFDRPLGINLFAP